MRKSKAGQDLSGITPFRNMACFQHIIAKEGGGTTSTEYAEQQS
jgi:hypothetical protein